MGFWRYGGGLRGRLRGGGGFFSGRGTRFTHGLGLGFADGGEDGVFAEDDGDFVVEVAEAGFGVVFGGGVALELLLAEFEFGFLDGAMRSRMAALR